MKKLSLLLALLMMLTCAFGSLAEVIDAPTEEVDDLIVIVEGEPDAPAEEEDSSGDSAGESAGFGFLPACGVKSVFTVHSGSPSFGWGG